MNLVESYAKSRDIKLLSLVTRDFQAPKFYEKIGYKCNATTTRLLKGLGQYFDSHHYYKHLER